MSLVIRKASKAWSRLRLALIGPAGSGKTYTAIYLALLLAKKVGKRVLVIDTERGSSDKYVGKDVYGIPFDFDILDLAESQHPAKYIEALQLAEKSGQYAVVVIDSLSHAWVGRDGALALVDNAAKRSSSGNSFAAWRDVTPLHNALVDAIIGSRLHVIATLRVKTEYVQEVNERGKMVPKKVGLAPIQRDGLDYEFDIVGDLDTNNVLEIGKTRCSELKGKMFTPDAIKAPGFPAFAETVAAWLTDGTDAPIEVVAQPTVADVIDRIAERKVNESIDEINGASNALAAAAEEASLQALVAMGKATHAAIEVAIAKEAAAPKPPTFLEAVETQAQRLGVDLYRRVLAIFGAASAEAITEREQQVEFFNMLKRTEIPAPAPVQEVSGKKKSKAHRLAVEVEAAA